MTSYQGTARHQTRRRVVPAAIRSLPSDVPPVRAPQLRQAIEIMSQLPHPTSRRDRQLALTAFFATPASETVEDEVDAIDARMEAFCRLCEHAILTAWLDARPFSSAIDAADVAACAPVVAGQDGDYSFDPDVFFSILLLCSPVAGTG